MVTVEDKTLDHGTQTTTDERNKMKPFQYSVRLRCSGEFHSISSVSEKLNLLPKVFRMGTFGEPEVPTKPSRKNSYALFEMPEEDEVDNDFELSLSHFLTRLEKAADQLLLLTTTGTKLTLTIAFFGEGCVGDVLSPDLVDRIGKMRLSIMFFAYFRSRSEESVT
jgi:hypothetical protein